MSIAAAWRQPLVATALAIAALLALFARDLADMAALWWNISTYQHCLYVLPIVAWLLWLRRDEALRVAPAGWPWGLLLVFTAALVWLIGEAASLAIIRHLGLVLMIQSTVLAILGPAFVRAIFFPLFYLIFLVPFGDEFVGPMQTLTARMTMGLLDLSGVPATIDGVFITTRAGWFEVAQACAGVANTVPPASGVGLMLRVYCCGTKVASSFFARPNRQACLAGCSRSERAAARCRRSTKAWSLAA